MTGSEGNEENEMRCVSTHHLCQSLQLHGPCASSPQGRQKACCEEQITICGNGSFMTEKQGRKEKMRAGEVKRNEGG
jgi:hypothetical protein